MYHAKTSPSHSFLTFKKIISSILILKVEQCFLPLEKWSNAWNLGKYYCPEIINPLIYTIYVLSQHLLGHYIRACLTKKNGSDSESKSKVTAKLKHIFLMPIYVLPSLSCLDFQVQQQGGQNWLGRVGICLPMFLQ